MLLSAAAAAGLLLAQTWAAPVTLTPMFPFHGKPGMVSLGDDLYAIGGVTSACMTGVRMSSDSGKSWGAFRCAAERNIPSGSSAVYHGCKLQDGPVGIGDEVTHELVLVFW